jgi:hypothetical protein
MSPIPEKAAWKVDSLLQSWSNLYAYAYPPTTLIRPCLNKLQEEQAEILLVAPLWPNQEWFPDLIALSIDFPLVLPSSRTMLKQTFSHHFHPSPAVLNLHVWRLSADPSKRRDFIRKCPRDSLFHRGDFLGDNINQNEFLSLNGADLEKWIHSIRLYR